MGMPVTIEVVAGGPRVRPAMDRAFDYLRWVDRTFSTYKADSEISRLNRGELKPAQADPAVREVLVACEEMKKKTSGYFDIHRGDGIDPSGYVKGWAVQGAAELLSKAGFENYFVEAGGDLQAHGHNADGAAWRVGIRNPFNRRENVKVLHVRNGAVATSGTYERGEHIYDPHTGHPATELAGITVVGPGIVEADVYATAAFAMGRQGADWIARQGLECYAIGHDGVATFTPGLNQYL